MLAQIILLVLNTVLGLLTFALLVRFAMQWARAPFRNPLGQFVMTATDWAVRPLRRFIPGLFGLDLASLVPAWFCQALLLGVTAGLTGQFGVSPASTIVVALLAVFETLKLGVYVAIGAVLVSAVLSWVNPYAPMADVFNAVSRPLLRPFSRLIPPMGGIDLSPLALLVALQIALIVLASLRQEVFALLR
jgi:YggT family protein